MTTHDPSATILPFPPLNRDHSPLVTVVMPAYNAEAYLNEAILSVVAQTEPSWELIVVDDCSTDSTPAIIHEWQLKDHRIHYLKTPHQMGGPPGVRQVGFAQARGQVFMSLDADDRYYPDSIQSLTAPLLENPALMGAYGFPTPFEEDGSPSVGIPAAHGYIGYHFGEVDRRHIPPFNWETILTSSLYMAALAMRREAYEAIGGMHAHLLGSEDINVYLRIAATGGINALHCINRQIYQYRKSSNSITHRPDKLLRLHHDNVSTLDELFTVYNLPPEAYAGYSKGLTWRYWSTIRTLVGAIGDNATARQLLKEAWQRPQIQRRDWWTYLGPLAVRTCWPLAVDRQIRRLVRVGAQ